MKRSTAIILCGSLMILIVCLTLILVKVKNPADSGKKSEKVSSEQNREPEEQPQKESLSDGEIKSSKDDEGTKSKEKPEAAEKKDEESKKEDKKGGSEKEDKKADKESKEDKKADDKKESEDVKKADDQKDSEKKDQEAKSEAKAAPAGDYAKYDNTKYGWWIVRTKDHTQPRGEDHVKLSDYDAYFVNPNVSDDDKVMYLAFDCGYEYGYTGKILDILKEHNVKGMFFLTKTFLDSDPDLARRMVDEGHMCGNHTITHPSLPSKSDEGVKKEILDLENYFKEVTGHELDKFIRPPMGEFSERTLKISQDLGYTSIFWSTVYLDYDVNNQPGKDYVVQYYRDNHHNGAITLTHTVSESNTQALGQVIEEMEALGYRFGTLDELKQ